MYDVVGHWDFCYHAALLSHTNRTVNKNEEGSGNCGMDWDLSASMKIEQKVEKKYMRSATCWINDCMWRRLELPRLQSLDDERILRNQGWELDPLKVRHQIHDGLVRKLKSLSRPIEWLDRYAVNDGSWKCNCKSLVLSVHFVIQKSGWGWWTKFWHYQRYTSWLGVQW